MKNTGKNIDTLIDNATEKIRDERLPDNAVSMASKRVWTRLSNQEGSAELPVVDHIRSCDDFRLLIPAYQRGVLPPARTLLFEDHMRECIPCRKALKDARNKGKIVRQFDIEKNSIRKPVFNTVYVRWALAAVIVLAIGTLTYPYIQRFLSSISTLQAIVEAADGDVYKVTSDKTERVKTGDKVRMGERLRTSKNSGAVLKMPDGTKIEMRERAEVRMSDTSSGLKINLDRGNLIIEAAKQKDRKLFVATDDTLVSVTGTIFSVNSGTKGSRVSVIEGTVGVDANGKNSVLNAGKQITTHPSIDPMPIKNEISWSRNYQEYVKLLDSIRNEIDSNVSMPGNHYSTKLLDMMPENTVLYVAVPNLSNTLIHANQILQENISKNSELNEWYKKENEQSKDRRGFSKILDLAREFGPYIGDEIVLSAQLSDKNSEPDEPFIIAELRNASGIRSMLETKLPEIGFNRERLHIVEDLSQNITGKKGDLYIWLTDSVIAASPNVDALKRIASGANTKSNNFIQSPFHAQIASIYGDGAGFIIAANLEKLVIEGLRDEKHKKSKVIQQLGVTDLRYFMVEVKEKDGKPFNRAIVSFKESDHGITTWLAQPGPMGALDFISPDASLVGAFVMKEPTAFIDDIFNAMKAVDENAWKSFQQFQSEKGFNLRNDFAGPMGGEYAFAIDGPLFPTPSWKMIVEVDDPVHLQSALEHTVSNLNDKLRKHGKRDLVWQHSETNGTKFYRLSSPDAPVEVNYAYVYGYLIAAPSKALVENAMKYRESGYSLVNSAKFKATLPEDKQANFSALVYQNITATLPAILKGTVSEAGKNAPKELRKTIETVLGNKATLAYVYAHNDRMILSVNSEDGPMGFTPSMFTRIPGFGF